MKAIPEPCPEFSESEIPNAVDLATAITVANKLADIVAKNEASLHSRINSILEYLEAGDQL